MQKELEQAKGKGQFDASSMSTHDTHQLMMQS
jgi:hypothetical protein